MTDTPENEDIENRGGPGRGQGRKPKLNPAAVQLVEALEGFIVGKGGEAWKSTQAEKNNICTALSDVLKSLGSEGGVNPYVALLGGCTLYAFGGRGRLSGADVGAKAAAAIKKKTGKKDATKAGTKSEAGGASPASTAPPPK